MSECPVCRSPLFGRPERCEECGTPLTNTVYSRSTWARILTLLFPGLGHLWLGMLVSGIFATFLSSISLLFLIELTADHLSFIRRLAVWLIFWVPWVSGWYWHVKDRRRLFVPAQRVATAIVLLLLASNLMILVNTLFVAMGWSRL